MMNDRTIGTVKKENHSLKSTSMATKIGVKSDKGITIIALIITIIVITILSGIIIEAAIDGRLFDKTNQSTEKVNAQVTKQEEKIQNILGVQNNINIPNETMYFVQSDVKNKTASSIEIETKAVSTEGKNLIYELYISSQESGEEYIKQATSAIVPSNTAVRLSATGLSNYTTYYWYVVAKDVENNSIKSDLQNIRTKCAGTTVTGYTCTTKECPGYRTVAETCTECNGTGTISQTCPGGSRIKCTQCRNGVLICGGTITSSSSTSGSSFTCAACGKWYGAMTRYTVKCSTNQHNSGKTLYFCSSCYNSAHGVCPLRLGTCTNCSQGYINVACEHGNVGECTGTILATCTTCYGNKIITTRIICSHGQTVAHRYCKHYDTTTLTSHECCEHGKVGEHD